LVLVYEINSEGTGMWQWLHGFLHAFTISVFVSDFVTKVVNRWFCVIALETFSFIDYLRRAFAVYNVFLAAKNAEIIC